MPQQIKVREALAWFASFVPGARDPGQLIEQWGWPRSGTHTFPICLAASVSACSSRADRPVLAAGEEAARDDSAGAQRGLTTAAHGSGGAAGRVVSGRARMGTLFRELRICDVVVFLNSRAGQSSMWCHSELVVVAELGKRVYSLDLAPDLPPHPLL